MGGLDSATQVGGNVQHGMNGTLNSGNQASSDVQKRKADKAAPTAKKEQKPVVADNEPRTQSGKSPAAQSAGQNADSSRNDGKNDGSHSSQATLGLSTGGGATAGAGSNSASANANGNANAQASRNGQSSGIQTQAVSSSNAQVTAGHEHGSSSHERK